MRRISSTTPGYDCLRNSCGKNGCSPKNPKHGICCDRWTYAITNGEFAVMLCAYSGIYPNSVPIDATMSEPSGSMLESHSAWPLMVDDVRTGSAGTACGLLDGCKCFNGDDTTAIGAFEFFKLHGAPTFVQPESFWLALEEYFKARLAEAEKVRRRRRCLCCDGSGVVAW